MMDILFFGRLGDVSPNISTALPDGVSDTDSLKTWLSKNNEVLATELSKTGNRIAVNKTVVNENTVLSNTDEVAFMSPLSGG